MQIWAVFAGSFASHKLLRTIPEVHSEIERLRVTGCCGWKKKRDDGIVDGTTIIFVHFS